MTEEQASRWKQVIGYIRDTVSLPEAILVARSCRVLHGRDAEGLAVVSLDTSYADLWNRAILETLADAVVAVYGVDGLRVVKVDFSPDGEVSDPDAEDAPPVPRGDTAIGIVDEMRERGSALAVVPGHGLVAVQTADRVIDPETYRRLGARAQDLAALIREHGTDVC